DDCVQALAGRNVWIFEDKDERGVKRALEAATHLYPVAASIKIIRLPGLTGEKGSKDVSDWLGAGHSKDELETICFNAPPWEPSAEQKTAKAEKSNSKPTILTYRRHRDANNPAPKYLVKNLLPEIGIGLLSGQSGTYKSFVAIKLSGAIAAGQPFAGYTIKR